MDFGRLLRLRDLGRVAEQAELVVHAHQRAAGVDRVRGGRPVARFLGDVGHDHGHLAARVLRGPHVVGRDHGLGRVGVQDVTPIVSRKGELYCRAGCIRSPTRAPICHRPKRSGKDLMEKKRMSRPLSSPARAFLPQVKAVGARILDRVVVDDLVAQFTPVVVVQVGRGGRVDAIRVDEQRTPVDQVAASQTRLGNDAERSVVAMPSRSPTSARGRTGWRDRP